MQIQNYIDAIEKIKEMNTQTGYSLSLLLGALKGEQFKQNAKEDNCDVKFTQQEINLMPKTFRKEFRVEGCTAHVRKKQNSKNSCSYEIRYRRNGYNVYASATTVEQAKQKFIEKLKTAERTQGLQATPEKFDNFAQHFFDNYYKEKVAPSTFANITSIYKKWIRSRFNIEIGKVTPLHCKQLLDEIKTKGYGKTADEVYSTLNQIFKYAIAYNLIQRNPLAIIPYKQHERVNGTRLTQAEEQMLFDKSTPKCKIKGHLAIRKWSKYPKNCNKNGNFNQLLAKIPYFWWGVQGSNL